MTAPDSRIKFVETCTSTNDLAHELLPTDSACAIVAAHQSKGRGRLGRAWVSEKNQGLYLSWRCTPPIPPAQGGALPLVAAVAIHQLCDDLGIDSILKWPNDVLVHGKKLAGILCEARIHGDHWHAVIGVGLNLAPPTEGWSQNLNATSIHEEIGVVVDRMLLASRLIDQLENVLRRFKVNGMSWLIAQWTLRGPQLGTVFAHNGRTGSYEGLTEEGAIRLRIDGSIAIVTAGDVELV